MDENEDYFHLQHQSIENCGARDEMKKMLIAGEENETKNVRQRFFMLDQVNDGQPILQWEFLELKPEN